MAQVQPTLGWSSTWVNQSRQTHDCLFPTVTDEPSSQYIIGPADWSLKNCKDWRWSYSGPCDLRPLIFKESSLEFKTGNQQCFTFNIHTFNIHILPYLDHLYYKTLFTHWMCALKMQTTVLSLLMILPIIISPTCNIFLPLPGSYPAP